MSEFDHPGAHEEKHPDEQVRDMAAELAAYGRRMEDLGRRLQERPERVNVNELFALLGGAPKAMGRLKDYRKALVQSWNLEDYSTAQEFGEPDQG